MSKIKVLHVLGKLAPGGIECWLLEAAKRTDRNKYQLDFAVLDPSEGSLEEAFLSLGSRIHKIGPPASLVKNPQRLRTLIRRNDYRIVHSHLANYSGWISLIAMSVGVPTRIAHSHTDIRTKYKTAPPTRRIYFKAMSALLRLAANRRLAVSTEAAESLYGRNWRTDPAVRIFPCGVDFDKFDIHVDKLSYRSALGIPLDSIVLSTVGRLIPAKNHAFLLEVFREFSKRRPDSFLVIVGDGALRRDLEQQAIALGLKDMVLFTGNRSDVPSFLLSVPDIFLQPSLFEGLPLTLLEAQAAGLPCLASSNITNEVAYTPSIDFAPLSIGPSGWAELIEARLARPTIAKSEALALARNSRYSIQTNVARLEEEYLSGS